MVHTPDDRGDWAGFFVVIHECSESMLLKLLLLGPLGPAEIALGCASHGLVLREVVVGDGEAALVRASELYFVFGAVCLGDLVVCVVAALLVGSWVEIDTSLCSSTCELSRVLRSQLRRRVELILNDSKQILILSYSLVLPDVTDGDILRVQYILSIVVDTLSILCVISSQIAIANRFISVFTSEVRHLHIASF